jgi:hypothetical protein
VKQKLRYLIGAALLLNGLTMLVAPAFWFQSVPGVRETGPLNLHLVRDVGCAYLVAALGLGWRALKGAPSESAAVLAAGFLLLHAGVHLWEVAVGICGWDRFLQDVPGVVVPGILVLWLSRADTQVASHA